MKKVTMMMGNMPLMDGTGLADLEQKILAPINWFKNIMLGLVAAVGAVILILGIVDLVGALGSGHKDITQIMNAVWKIVGGILMVAIGALIIAFTG